MKDFNLLKSLYEIHSPSGQEKKMRKFVKRMAVQRGAEVVQDVHGNLYVTKGVADTYPCICAHLDQVQHIHSKDFKVYKQDDIIFAYSAKAKMQQGLGADDKNGIWIALELLEVLDVLKCAFFVGEETGCVGSSQADMKFFNDVRYCIEPDRRNGSDLITDICGEICSEDFLSAIDYESFGYKPTTGLMTDVEELCENGVGVSCINISCGYYNPHTDEECTSWSELCNAFDFALHICTKLTDVYPHTYVSSLRQYGGYWGGTKNHKIGYVYNDDWYDSWYTKRYGKGCSASKNTSTDVGNTDSCYDYDPTYTYHDRQDDTDTMTMILEEEPHLTFEEVKRDYAEMFISLSDYTLRSIYNVVIERVANKIYYGNLEAENVVENTDKQLELTFNEEK
jgi:hypothetical protein